MRHTVRDCDFVYTDVHVVQANWTLCRNLRLSNPLLTLKQAPSTFSVCADHPLRPDCCSFHCRLLGVSIQSTHFWPLTFENRSIWHHIFFNSQLWNESRDQRRQTCTDWCHAATFELWWQPLIAKITKLRRASQNTNFLTVILLLLTFSSHKITNNPPHRTPLTLTVHLWASFARFVSGPLQAAGQLPLPCPAGSMDLLCTQRY